MKNTEEGKWKGIECPGKECDKSKSPGIMKMLEGGKWICPKCGLLFPNSIKLLKAKQAKKSEKRLIEIIKRKGKNYEE